MKVLNRVLGLTVIGFFCILIVLQLINVDIRRDEMNTISSLAMNQTQTILEEQIADDFYGTNNARKRINNNQEYFNEYLKNFQKLVTTNSNYQVELLNADYKKGLLDVKITCRYLNIVGKEKQMDIRKTSIIETVDKREETTGVIKYKITYDLQQGRIIGKNPTEFNEFSSNQMVLTNPSRTGYEFLGWTGSNGNVPQKTVTIDINRKENLHFIANWKIQNYTITYDLDGGTNNYSNPSSYNIETDNFTIKDPSKPGYSFKGWVGSNGNVPKRNIEINRGQYGNKTFKAIWDNQSYRINYHLDGGSNHIDNPSYFSRVDSNIDLKSPSKRGYNFKGWYLDPSFRTPVTIIDTGKKGDINVYAKWEGKIANVTFRSNNGENKTLTKSYQVGANPADLRLTFPNWERYGYNAIGYTDPNGTKVYGLTEQVTPEWIIEHEGECNLDVKWDAKKVNVTIYKNDGSNSSIERTYYYDKDGKLPDASEWGTLAGKSPVYYSLSKDGGQALEMGAKVTNAWINENEGATRLYVIWQKDIIYGYQDARTYSRTATTSAPDNGFYKKDQIKMNQKVGYEGNTILNAKEIFDAEKKIFLDSVNGLTLKETGDINVVLHGSNDQRNWLEVGRWYAAKDSKFDELINAKSDYRYYRVVASGGDIPYNWKKFELNGHYFEDGYYAVTSWGNVNVMDNYNSYKKTNSRRLVYSRDNGRTWTECNNYGSSCPMK